MKNMDYAEIGARIRAARIMQKLTQEEASEKCDITSSFYGNIERGDKKMSVETLIKISVGLGISTDSLLFGDSPRHAEQLTDILGKIRSNTDEKQFEKYLAVIKTLATIIDKL